MKTAPIHLTRPHADILLAQFQETAAFREWLLLAVAIMTNHFHLVVGAEGDPDPERILGDFKSYDSRRLVGDGANRHQARGGRHLVRNESFPTSLPCLGPFSM